MKRLIGTKAFYRHLLVIVVPILIQNGITFFVNLLDNIMVGQVGTNPMSGVSIINQLIFIFNLCLFGGVAGAGIFTAQFFGQQNHEGVRYTFRYKIIIAVVIDIVAIAIFMLFQDVLVGFYLNNGEAGTDPQNGAEILRYAKQYLTVMYFEMIPFSVSQAYASTLRESNQTMLPMKAGIVAIIINLCLNYILIFGKFGAPALGVVGAAIATAVSRYVEAAIIVIYTHTHAKEHPFIRGAFASLYIPGKLLSDMIKKGFPLLLNETLWSMGIAALSANYAYRGLEVIAAFNISSTLSNLFNVVLISMGSATAIILGQELGAGDPKVRDDADRLAFTAVTACIVTGALQFLCAWFFPEIYNTEPEVKALATHFIMITACFAPVSSYLNVAYFTIRSGGKTWITFVFDSGFLWAFAVPFSFILTRFTDFSIMIVYILVLCVDILKAAFGFYLVRKGTWVQNLTVS